MGLLDGRAHTGRMPTGERSKMARNMLVRGRSPFAREGEDGGGGGGQTGENGQGGSESGKDGKGSKEFQPITSQEDLDRIITDRVARERKKYPANWEQVVEKASQWDLLERESQTDTERRERELREEAFQEAMSKAVPVAVRAEFRAQAREVGLTNEQVASLLEDLDLVKYATDEGEPDEGKIARKILAFAPAKGGGDRNGGRGPGFGQGSGHNQSSGIPGERGLAEAERRFGKRESVSAGS